MVKKYFSFFLVSMLFAAPAMAEIIHLKNGTEVTGKILEKADKSVKVDVGGTTMTYYADQIKDIDGTAFQPVLAKEASIPAASPVGNKRNLILKFIDVFGTRAAMTENLEAMMKTMPADDAEVKKLKENIKVNEIIDRLVPVYDKQFSEEDLKAFITFYSSPAGRKLVSGIPVIMKESIGVSSQYFQEKFPELKDENKT